MASISMKALLEAGVHFGHQTRRWNPKMSKYIFGSRNNIHIIDLQKTVKELKKALTYVRDLAADGKTLLFVGTKKQAREAISQEAARCGMPFIRDRWLGGTLTNFETVRRSAKRLQELERMKQSGVFGSLSKKETMRREKDIKRLAKSLDGIKNMDSLPHALFIVDPVQEITAVTESRRMEIPIVSICDTNCDPDLIDWPMPGNDDAIRSVRLFCKLVADSVLEGREMAKRKDPAAADASAPEGEIALTDSAADAPVVPVETTNA
ncbi:MAG TPA: 30S ribosomal protein S2 [Elusimicrobiota bacterium]|nr:30S ribosomal protein S2 [Elusimicrobiota bacterium]HMU95309.1 30S ribosomal protein S2 [Elusimicrobiota bacterium]HMX42444.1 30S ribosomal protein S2 [Elusimicrobiota bacterium]HMZ26027.1 30S ribosomal protein S2 [Elusimicrobiota bacterium]HNA60393.1 30S ribosomal protein S2 [Elusimicrobiota bacterium]